MASLIHELENNEALLLMYAANELSAADHVDVEQQLANDAGLRAELERIKSAYDGSMRVLAELDCDRSTLAAENHAIRQANRAMKQWQLDRLLRQSVVLPTARYRFPFWLYPVATAASLMLAGLIWWGQQDFPDSTKLASTKPVHTTQQEDVAPALTEDDSAKANLLDKSFRSDIPSTIVDAETEADALTSPNDAAIASFRLEESNQ